MKQANIIFSRRCSAAALVPRTIMDTSVANGTHPPETNSAFDAIALCLDFGINQTDVHAANDHHSIGFSTRFPGNAKLNGCIPPPIPCRLLHCFALRRPELRLLDGNETNTKRGRVLRRTWPNIGVERIENPMACASMEGAINRYGDIMPPNGGFTILGFVWSRRLALAGAVIGASPFASRIVACGMVFAPLTYKTLLISM